MHALKWGAIWVFGLVVAFLIFGAMQPQKDNRQACTNAIMSNMGTSTAGYADRQAYDQRVANDCQGFDIPRR